MSAPPLPDSPGGSRDESGVRLRPQDKSPEDLPDLTDLLSEVPASVPPPPPPAAFRCRRRKPEASDDQPIDFASVLATCRPLPMPDLDRDARTEGTGRSSREITRRILDRLRVA